MNEDGDDYAVGYGKPPRASQFKHGTSGNAAGRPRKNQSASSLINAILNERINVRENGRTTRMSKLAASLKQLTNKAIGGDIRSALAVIAMAQLAEANGDAVRATTPLDEADKRVLELLGERLERIAEAPDGAE